ncbi:hypothetical protein ACJMK2_010191 [Sinanodonta woodiana]|uniref:Uncharacterized protein n=1 Tax=Sinanodonta woodiana TaxID=1069815 RepID=A0ABD3VHJ6_SINWO
MEWNGEAISLSPIKLSCDKCSHGVFKKEKQNPHVKPYQERVKFQAKLIIKPFSSCCGCYFMIRSKEETGLRFQLNQVYRFEDGILGSFTSLDTLNEYF